MKVSVLIPAHCHPETLFLTVGTWLRYKTDAYSASLSVSLHANYGHYHKSGLADIQRVLGPFASIVHVQEIDWHKWSRMRYSKMHAVSLLALFDTIPDDADYVAIFDHDLYFFDDFISWASSFGVDMVCSLYEDRAEVADVMTEDDVMVRFMPKPSVWHTLLSRRFVDHCMRNPELVLPVEEDIVYDTLSAAYHSIDEVGFTSATLQCRTIEQLVRHEQSMSFNLGTRFLGDKYQEKVEKLQERYRLEFPHGIQPLLEVHLKKGAEQKQEGRK